MKSATATPCPMLTAAIISPPLDDFRTLDDLHHKLTVAGFIIGVPAALTLASRAADQRTCAHMKCPACRRRGLAYTGLTAGATCYRVIASCPDCNAARRKSDMVRLFRGGVYHTRKAGQDDFDGVRDAAATPAHALRRPHAGPMVRSAELTAAATAGSCSARISSWGGPGPTPRRSGC